MHGSPLPVGIAFGIQTFRAVFAAHVEKSLRVQRSISHMRDVSECQAAVHAQGSVWVNIMPPDAFVQFHYLRDRLLRDVGMWRCRGGWPEQDDHHLAGVRTTEHICCTSWAALRSYDVSHAYQTLFFYLLL